jgi:3-deoxy-D-manno-octulosonic-acid transferase
MPRPTLVYRLYVAISALLAPLAFRRISKKLAAQDVPAPRIRERLGRATMPRPDGPLIWFHAASVGESLSVLTLIARLGTLQPDLSFLITSGTATSAKLIAQRLPPRSVHQFAPLDARAPLNRFLTHWHPDGAVFVESELWPQMLIRTKATGIPMVLLNARLSEKSVRTWHKLPATAAFLLGQFDRILTQNRTTADNLVALGADPACVAVGENLKATSAPLPVDPAALEAMQAQIGRRPVWVASSTHAGEEEIVLDAHKLLLASHPDLCLILVPRHPERADTVNALIIQAGLRFAKRSAEAPLAPDSQVYLADTLGETGLWYTLCPLVFLGGSLLPIGGHNPFEVAQAGGAVVSGPHVTNFAETFEALQEAGAVRIVNDSTELALVMKTLLDAPGELDAMRTAVTGFVTAQSDRLDTVATNLSRDLQLR